MRYAAVLQSVVAGGSKPILLSQREAGARQGRPVSHQSQLVCANLQEFNRLIDQRIAASPVPGLIVYPEGELSPPLSASGWQHALGPALHNTKSCTESPAQHRAWHPSGLCSAPSASHQQVWLHQHDRSMMPPSFRACSAPALAVIEQTCQPDCRSCTKLTQHLGIRTTQAFLTLDCRA